MNAAASPGRTWNIFVSERGLPALAPAAATGVLCLGPGVAGLSGLDGVPPTTRDEIAKFEDDPRRKRAPEWSSGRELGCDYDSVSVTSCR